MMCASLAQSAFPAALLVVALTCGPVAARAQTVCNSIGETAFCQGAEGNSTMLQVGDTIYVTRSDGSSAIHQRVGDTTVITDSREGMSGVAQHLGDTMLIQLVSTSSVCNKLGPTMWCS